MTAILSHALIVLDIASMKVFVWMLRDPFTWAVDPNGATRVPKPREDEPSGLAPSPAH